MKACICGVFLNADPVLFLIRNAIHYSGLGLKHLELEFLLCSQDSLFLFLFYSVLFQIKIMGVDFTCKEDVFFIDLSVGLCSFHQSCVISFFFWMAPICLLKLKRKRLMNRINLNYFKKNTETLNKPVFVINILSVFSPPQL